MNHRAPNPDNLERHEYSSIALQKARKAIEQGNHRMARRFAEQAAALAPETEEPWLFMAALASPNGSIAYLERALKINPNSQRARKGLKWAQDRLNACHVQSAIKAAVAPQPASFESGGNIFSLSAAAPNIVSSTYAPLLPTRREMIAPVIRGAPSHHQPFSTMFYYVAATFFFSIALFIISLLPLFPKIRSALDLTNSGHYSSFLITSNIYTPTNTPFLPRLAEIHGVSNPTVTPGIISQYNDRLSDIPSETPPLEVTEEPTLTETPTLSPTNTLIPTETPSPTTTPTLEPTPSPSEIITAPTANAKPTANKKSKKKVSAGPGIRPSVVDLNDRWIDIDLSSQTTYAMKGDEVVRSFIVSTGRWPTLTVEGVFRIYAKYKKANMSGADYFLPNVPHVMFFFKGYSIHGTYWHNNFGTPMSHGCVNLQLDDASWLFDFATVGTVVSVHQ